MSLHSKTNELSRSRHSQVSKFRARTGQTHRQTDATDTSTRHIERRWSTAAAADADEDETIGRRRHRANHWISYRVSPEVGITAAQ